MNVKWKVAGLIEAFDQWFHCNGRQPPRWLCSAADTCYGWGPDAIDWAERSTLFDRMLCRWLYGAK